MSATSGTVTEITHAKRSLMESFAEKYGMSSDKMMTTLKATAFRVNHGSITNDQMVALVVVANQYGLNPFTKEIYAFPDRGGIVPVGCVDGWSRIVNESPEFDGMDFIQDAEGCTCRIYRKDRSHPVAVTEYVSECSRGTAPWKSHPKRMMRHKAFIQCARMAFGFVGIYDEDEAARIIDVTPQNIPPASPNQNEPASPAFYSDENFSANFPKWKEMIESGKATALRIISTVESKARLSDAQKKQLNDMKEPIDGELT